MKHTFVTYPISPITPHPQPQTSVDSPPCPFEFQFTIFTDGDHLLNERSPLSVHPWVRRHQEFYRSADRAFCRIVLYVLYVLKPAKRADFSMIGRFVNFLMEATSGHSWARQFRSQI